MNLLIVILQLFSYSVLYLPLNFLFRLTVINKLEHGEFHQGMLLTANHQSRVDALLLYVSIPPMQYIKLLPMYALVTERYMNSWWKKITLTCLGCVPLRSDEIGASEALLSILDIIDRGNTVILFPEGKIVRRGEIAKANPGIGYLALKKNIKIVPIYIGGFRNVTIIKVLQRKYRAKIIFGKSKGFYNQTHYNPKKVSEHILKRIYSLSSL